jgi:hypothetical protein
MLTINERIDNSLSSYPMRVRFWGRVKKTPDGCWIWMGAKRNKKGYGTFCEPITGKQIYAHRFSWEWHNGAIPMGVFVLHKCDNPACVNPDHLKLGDAMDNNHDSISKGRAWWQK